MNGIETKKLYDFPLLGKGFHSNSTNEWNPPTF